MKDREIVRLALVVAKSVELRGGLESAGIIRQLARRVLDNAGCERCGGPIERKRSGRPPKFCSSRCRVAAHRETKRVS